MPAVTDEQAENVRALVASIPAGRVSTYGDIADAVGLSSPRIVGWIMRTDSSDLPWHRVIRASGRPAPHLTTRQLELLRAEGGSEEHTSELQSPYVISYAAFFLNKSKAVEPVTQSVGVKIDTNSCHRQSPV